MTGAGGFRVVPEVLDTQAGLLDGIAGEVAARQPSRTELDTDAYGVVGGLFAAEATAAMRAGATAMQEMAGALRALASATRTAASDYRDADRRAAVGLAGVEVGPPAAGPR